MTPGRALLAGAVASLCLVGCGYVLGPPGFPAADPHASRTIVVAPLDNNTHEPLLGEILTNRLKRQLLASGAWRIANIGGHPDFTLTGRIDTVKFTPIAFDADGRAAEYGVEVHAVLTLTRSTDGAVIWSIVDFTSAADYYANLDVTATRQSKERSFEDAGQRFAEQVAQRLTLSIAEAERAPAPTETPPGGPAPGASPGTPPNPLPSP